MERPLADWPALEVRPHEQAVYIYGGYTAPSAWWSRGFPILLMLASLPGLPASCASFANSAYGGMRYMPDMHIAYFLIAWLAGGVVLWLLGEYFGRKRQVKVRMTAETIEIGRRSYARGQGIQFEIDEHERAFDEAQDVRSGHAGRLYLDAMQVVMRYGERWVPVAAFRRNDLRKAEALLRRLQALNEPRALEMLFSMSGEDEAPGPDDRDDFGPAKPLR